MFSGIVQGFTEVTQMDSRENFKSFAILIPDDLIQGLERGASVAIDGVCMTVVKIDGNQVYFDAMKETLDLTTLGNLELGDKVNIERSVRYGDEIGGHGVSGHVHGKAEIINIDREFDNNVVFSFQVPKALIKYTFDKGFVALNGASLTIVDVNREKAIIRVSFIPETLRKTTFANKNPGDPVNIEIEQQTQAIVETIERYLEAYNPIKSR